jgi:DNA replication and repair protein RecF
MISNIRLQNFRSYTDESFEFGKGVNIIVGPNGSGKTNLLEAIQVLSTGYSYRANDGELIKFESDWARLDAETGGVTRTLKIVNESNHTKKSYVFDDKPYKILTHSHVLPVVLFEPNHLQLLHGQPEQRRNYLDNLLELMTPGFNMTRKHYRRVLTQRNALLKSAGRPAKDQLFVWNLRLSELGGAIASARHELVEDIAKELPNFYNRIAGSKKTNVDISYKSKLPRDRYETTLLRALETSYDLDVARGFTGAGPHRDDFIVRFDGHPTVEVASRGETRTALLALKINELKILEEKSEKKPLLLLDDVFSELDGKRRHALTKYLKYYQTFITTTDADVVVQNFLDECTIIPLERA